MSASTATAAPVAANGAAEAPVESIVEAYVATWNETDSARRQAGIARAWSASGCFRDPVMAGDGPAEIDALLAGVQARFPGFVLKRTSKIDCYKGPDAQQYVRFSWSLGPAAGPSVVEGVDFGTLTPDGKLASVVGFFDKVPAA